MKTAIAFLTLALVPSLLLAEDQVDYVKDILPIFERRCTKCHGERKAEGEVRLHTAQAIRDYDVDYLLAPGKPDESSLYERITLPEDDELRMPKGGDPLPKEQIELVRLWIEQGAPLPEGEMPVEDPEDLEPQVDPAPPEAISSLGAAGAQVLPLYADSPLLQVTFAYSSEPATDEALAAVAGAADQIVWLNLSKSAITDAGTAPLAALTNLQRLHLELTDIGDDTLLYLSGLERLEYLNLYGTKVTDAGLDHLKNLKNLKSLYLWQTDVSYAAAMAMEEAIPGLEVNLGWNHPEVARARLTEELERVKAQKEDAEQRESQARQEKESAAEREAELEKELKALTGEPEEEEQPAEETSEEKPAEDAPAEKADEDKSEEDKSDEDKSDEDKSEEETPEEETPEAESATPEAEQEG